MWSLLERGISGIAAAIQLKQLGIPFTVVERQAGIGGTWLLNTYPEARVDTSSFLFQYTFEKNYKWTEHFAASEENQAYLTYIATKNNVKEHFIFNREVMGAEWNQKDSKWTIQINNKQSGEKETMVANVMISATGVLSTPRLPDIKSIKDFKGPIFHTAQWNHSVPYKDARCALIGTGSTGTQLAPGLAQYAKSLAVYQRSPNWIIPIEGYREPVQDYQKWLCDAMPYYWNWFCYSMYFQSLQVAPLQEHDYAWQAKGGLVNERNDALRLTLTDFIRNKFIDRPDLFEKLLPNHAPLVRRPPIDNGFYDCLKQDNVELVTDKIDHIDETGIVTQDGKHREFDMIVLGSGFMPFKMASVNYVGRDGITLEETWKKDGARSYLGMTIPGYPNLFTLYGPNHQPRGGSMHSWAEIWTRYAVAAIVHMIENESSSIEIRDDVFEEYNERLDEANKALIWESQGHGYYVNEFGRQCVNMPWRTHLYHQMVKMPKYEEYYIK
jgi:4-hydroxyacetophenone monooxygenase